MSTSVQILLVNNSNFSIHSQKFDFRIAIATKKKETQCNVLNEEFDKRSNNSKCLEDKTKSGLWV